MKVKSLYIANHLIGLSIVLVVDIIFLFFNKSDLGVVFGIPLAIALMAGIGLGINSETLKKHDN